MLNPDVCEFVVVRHGQTEANISGVLQGQLDTPLDATGIAQAEAIAERLKNDSFDMVFSSDLGRTMNTAEIILKYHPELTIHPVTQLREWNLGDLQSKPYSLLKIQYPEIMAAFKTSPDDLVVPNGESLAEFQKRVSDFMNELANEYPGKRLLLVSHGGATQRMFRHVVGPVATGNITPLCANSSLSVFRHSPSGWQLITWNDTAHLAMIKTHDTLTF